jgi:hypothetical protein
MAEHKGLVSSGWDRVAHNKRYIIWFYVLNLVLAGLGAAAFGNQAHDYLDHSLLSARLVNGMNLGVLVEMFIQPEFGPVHAATAASLHFALAFFLLTAAFMPGVLQGYASTYRLPRDDFFRACGRNLWRFTRLMIITGLVLGAVAVALFSLQGALVKAAEESTNEILPFEVRMLCLLVIFLVMTVLRIWFDLAEADVVLSDQNAVRKSVASGFRCTWDSLGRLLGSYILATIVALIILCAGMWAWAKLIPPPSVLGAFVITQLVLLLLLIPRFWQRGVAVSYYLQNMVAPIAVQTPTPVVGSPTSAPVSPIPPPEPQAS